MVQRAHSLLRRPLAPQWTPCYHQNPSKISKTIKFAPSTPNSTAPWWRIAKTAYQFVRLAPKMLPTKFHPNLLTFGNTYWEKTGERRRTPPYSMGRFATQREGLRPTWGGWGEVVWVGRVASRPLSFARTALKKGNYLASLGG